MSEYCEYMWNPTRGTSTSELARSIYLETAKLETKDKKLAVRTVRAILRGMPNIGKHTQLRKSVKFYIFLRVEITLPAC